MADSPYPELKKTHTMARQGRPWTDTKPPPAASVWSVIQGLGSYFVLVAALELEVFDTLDNGPQMVKDLAQSLEVSEPHLNSLLDSLVVLGLLDQVEGVYDLNEVSSRYLLSDGPASMSELIPVAPGPYENWKTLVETVRTGRPPRPIDDDPGSFYTPLAEGTFTTVYRCASLADRKLRYSALVAPRVLELGAGGAPWAVAILERCPEATAVINDLEEVLDVARSKTFAFGVDSRCEFRGGDFHTVQIEDSGFDLAVLSHVCRTEGAEGARHLIERGFDALKPGGRLLLADYFVDPEHKANPHAVMMGITMMASTVNGFPITNAEVASWLRDAGFQAVRLIEPIGFQFVYVAQKACETS